MFTTTQRKINNMNDLEMIANQLSESMFPKPEYKSAYDLVGIEVYPNSVDSKDQNLGSVWHLRGKDITEKTAHEIEVLLAPLKDRLLSVVKEARLFVKYMSADDGVCWVDSAGACEPYVRIYIEWGNDLYKRV
jgi:hypothetical protein